MSLRSLREKANIRLYESKDTMLKTFRILSLLVALSVIGTLVYYYGFPKSVLTKVFHNTIIQASFGFYILNYLIRFVYNFEPLQFIKRTWLELLLLILLIIDGISYYLFNTPLIQSFCRGLGIHNFSDVYIIFAQLYLLTIILTDVVLSDTSLIPKIRLQPSSLFIFSFITLISMGCGLLMLPEMTTVSGNISFLEALFTSTSASCVTGLILVDTATFFTLKGQVIIMILIQMGGLSIISFATFFASLGQSGIGIKHQSMLKDYFSTSSLMDTKGMFRQIIFLSFTIEAIGTIVVYSLWPQGTHFSNTGEKLFFSVFHSISAFNNAGFSIFSNGMYESPIKNGFILHLAIAGLIFFGSIGFHSIREIFGIGNLRERLKLRWKHFGLTTQIALYSTVSLIIFGAVLFYFLERNNTLYGQNTVEASITSLFQSVTCRTAGFNTVDIGNLSVSTLIVMMFLMFIGASSGSTGGGIKTSTFTIILLSAYSTIRGKRNLEIFKHSISFELLNKAFSIFLFSSSFILTCTFLLSVFDPNIHIAKLLFEEISAFSTVGLSTGITTALSVPGKIIIIISMFIGRVGPLTLAFALSRRIETTKYKYPSAHFMVG